MGTVTHSCHCVSQQEVWVIRPVLLISWCYRLQTPCWRNLQSRVIRRHYHNSHFTTNRRIICCWTLGSQLCELLSDLIQLLLSSWVLFCLLNIWISVVGLAVGSVSNYSQLQCKIWWQFLQYCDICNIFFFEYIGSQKLYNISDKI